MSKQNKVMPKDEGAVGGTSMLERRLDEMQAIIRAGSRWNGNEQEFAEKGESDVTMLDDLLSDAFRLLHAAQPVAASAAGLEVLDWTRDGMIDGTEFVRLDDVRPLLATQSAKQGAQAGAVIRMLRCAMDSAWTPSSYRADIIGHFCKEWNRAAVDAAVQVAQDCAPVAEVRDQALEEAAKLSHEMYESGEGGEGTRLVAERIRALMKSGSQSKGEGEKA